MKQRNRVTVFNMVSTLILTGISIFTSPLFSRLLDTSGYGILSTYNVWTQVMTILAFLNTGSTLVYARVQYPEEEQVRYQSAVMTLSLVAFSACCILIVVFLGPISRLLKLSYGLLALLMVQSFGTFCTNFLSVKFQYELKAGRNMVFSLLTAGLSLGLSLVLVLSMPQQDRYVGRILGNAIVYAALGLGACAFILLRGKTFFRLDHWKFCLKLVPALIFMDLSYLVLGHSDLVMVRNFLGDSPAGIYGMAYTFSGVMFAIFTALNRSWVPFYFDGMKSGDAQRVSSQARNFLELFTVLSMGFVLLTNEVFHIFASRDYWPGTGLIPIFVLGYYLNFLCTFPINYEHYHMKVKIVSTVTVAASLLNVLLNYILIQRMGMQGAVIATACCQGLPLLVHQAYIWVAFRGEEYPFGLRLLWSYLAAFCGALLLTLLLPEAWLPRWLLGGLIGIWELLRIKKRGVLI